MQLRPNSMPGVTMRSSLAALIVLVSAAAAEPGLGSREVALIEEAYHVWSTQADKVWPGASSVRTPIIYVQESQEYAIGFTRPLTGFVDAGHVGPSRRPAQVRPRTLPADVSAFLGVDGAMAVAMGSPEALNRSPEAWVITACHEMFHGYQHAHGGSDKMDSLAVGSKEAKEAWQLTFPFPYGDADIMRLIHIQGHLLWLALSGTDRDEAKYNVGTALDAVRVYRSRLNGLMPDGKAHNYSLLQEWSEGVAAYTEFKIAEAVGTGDHRPTAGFSQILNLRGYASVWKEGYQHRTYLVKHAGRAAKNRDAFYHLGMGKALALDVVLPDWKRKYLKPGVWLDDLLNQAIESR